MPETSSVARRYASGIFLLAQEENAIDTWRAELAKLDEMLQDDVLVAAFRNPAVGVSRRMELAKLLGDDTEAATINAAMHRLGNEICVSEMPACERCPLEALCSGRPC